MQDDFESFDWSAFDVRTGNPELDEFGDFLWDLMKESDRGLILITTAFLDEQLRRVLSAFCADERSAKALLDGFNAPLGTFAARIKAAYAFGLIDKDEMHDIDRLRDIRNQFAHKVKMTFDDPKVLEQCRALKFGEFSEIEKPGLIKDGPRPHIYKAVVTLVLRLTKRTSLVAARKCVHGEWH